jgi:hypothetical protein
MSWRKESKGLQEEVEEEEEEEEEEGRGSHTEEEATLAEGRRELRKLGR